MEGYRSDTYGQAYADVYDEWYGAHGDTDGVVDAISDAATRTGGAILELGIGTGRLAIPLAGRGHEVVGVDASSAMLEKLGAKTAGRPIEVHRTDMSRLDSVPRTGRFGVAFAAFNTFLGLYDEDDRRSCLTGVARLLAPGGRLALETIVPGPEPDSDEDHVEIRTLETDRLILTVSRRDPRARTVSGHHVELTDGEPVRLRPWQLGYLAPDDLDREAAASGLTLERRASGWDGAPYSETSPTHVSWYRPT